MWGHGKKAKERPPFLKKGAGVFVEDLAGVPGKEKGGQSDKEGTDQRESSPSLTWKEQLKETRPMVRAQLWPPAHWGTRCCAMSVSSCAFRMAW